MPNFCGECGESVGADQKCCSSCGGALNGEQPKAQAEVSDPSPNKNLRTDPRYKCPKCGGKSFYMGWKPPSVQTGILDTDTQARFCGSCDVQMTWIRVDQGLPQFLGRADMAQRGWTETFGPEGPSNAEVVSKLEDLAQELF